MKTAMWQNYGHLITHTHSKCCTS